MYTRNRHYVHVPGVVSALLHFYSDYAFSEKFTAYTFTYLYLIKRNRKMCVWCCTGSRGEEVIIFALCTRTVFITRPRR